MSNPLPRETATERRDLPHAYEQTGRVCGVCGEGEYSELHKSWVQQAAEQQAAPKISWEIGS